jgi:hypothetical protein
MQSNFATYRGFAAVTPSATTLVNCRALWVGGTGTLVLSPDASTTGVTLSAVPAGTLIPIELNQGRVVDTSTATLIVALV